MIWEIKMVYYTRAFVAICGYFIGHQKSAFLESGNLCVPLWWIRFQNLLK